MGFTINNICSIGLSNTSPEYLGHPVRYIHSNDEFLRRHGLTVFGFSDSFLAGVLQNVNHAKLAHLIRSYEREQQDPTPFEIEHEVNKVVDYAQHFVRPTRQKWKDMILYLEDLSPIGWRLGDDFVEECDEDYVINIAEMKQRIRRKAGTLC
ncbi:MAG: hypothetical protein EOP45_21370 [Sphingobacteriaceae bacterium]|nr:MAG: hypothetical protein EOP45_21370 [Sphingobacteriaceae bacterium]